MTIRELAKALELSKTTVADALRGKSSVSPATRAYVHKRARQLGYELNPVASAFLRQVRLGKSDGVRAMIAWLVPTYGLPHAGSVGIQQITQHQGMVERAAELGYRVDIIDVGTYDDAQLTRMLVSRGVLGVVAGPLLKAAGHITLDWSKFACVAFGYSLNNPSLHRVVPNHYHAVQTVVASCRRQGFKRIGLALRHESEKRSDGLWSAGFWSCQRSLPAAEKVRPLLVADADYNAARIGEWIRREKPDAVIFHNRALVPDIPELRPRRPGAVIPVVLDRLPTDTCAGIDQDFRLSGSRLVDAVSAQILHNERGIPASPQITLVTGKWVPAAAGPVPRK